jgi:2-polyprenyl-3-methyl-5-hydroxy-6-metoxy-1,4-benzoquinol methylase
MSNDGFSHYQKRAELTNDPTLIAGRYSFQREAERRIGPDVQRKLELCPTDRLLDIGGGPGNLAIPLSFLVHEVWVIDNPKAIEVLASRAGNMGNVRLIAASFEEAKVDVTFEKILIYSVIQYLPDVQAIQSFLLKAVGLLKPGGRLLIGDLPNTSRKGRFMASRQAAQVDDSWNRSMSNESATEAFQKLGGLPANTTGTNIDDEVIAGLILFLRSLGFEAYLVPQPEDLPFGLTREDILVVAHR